MDQGWETRHVALAALRNHIFKAPVKGRLDRRKGSKFRRFLVKKSRFKESLVESLANESKWRKIGRLAVGPCFDPWPFHQERMGRADSRRCIAYCSSNLTRKPTQKLLQHVCYWTNGALGWKRRVWFHMFSLNFLTSSPSLAATTHPCCPGLSASCTSPAQVTFCSDTL